MRFSGNVYLKRFPTLGLIALIHIIIIWMLATAMQIRSSRQGVSVQWGEIYVKVISPNLGPREAPLPPTDWEFLQPDAVNVPAPEIEIAPQDPRGSGAAPIMQKLPPRLDPAHINPKPQLPHMLGVVGSLALELRILILQDGSVGQADIIRSAGDSEIDRLAIRTVQDTWRYLPAEVNGKPVEAWTTVIVRFASI